MKTAFTSELQGGDVFIVGVCFAIEDYVWGGVLVYFVFPKTLDREKLSVKRLLLNADTCFNNFS